MLNDLCSVYVKVASLNENVAKGERKDTLEHGLKCPTIPSIGKSHKYLTYVYCTQFLTSLKNIKHVFFVSVH